jgi:hypothetical protein
MPGEVTASPKVLDHWWGVPPGPSSRGNRARASWRGQAGAPCRISFSLMARAAEQPRIVAGAEAGATIGELVHMVAIDAAAGAAALLALGAALAQELADEVASFGRQIERVGPFRCRPGNPQIHLVAQQTKIFHSARPGPRNETASARRSGSRGGC